MALSAPAPGQSALPPTGSPPAAPLRGRLPEAALGARELERLARNPHCTRLFVLTLAGLTPALVLQTLYGETLREVQSPFALAAGTGFEAAVGADGAAALLTLYRRTGRLAPAACRLAYANPEPDSSGDPAKRARWAARTRAYLRRRAADDPTAPTLIWQPLLALPFADRAVPIIPDALVALAGQPGYRVVEIKSFLDRAGETDPAAVRAALRQAAVGVLALRAVARDLGIADPEVFAPARADLVLRRPASRAPTLTAMAVAGEVASIGTVLARASAEPAALHARLAGATLDEVATLEALPASYRETCREHCALAVRCRRQAVARSEPIVLGPAVAEQIGPAGTIDRAYELAAGRGAPPGTPAERVLAERLGTARTTHQEALAGDGLGTGRGAAGDDLETYLRVAAFAERRAQPAATHRRVAIQPEALIVAPLAMAGEPTTLHLIAMGRLGGPPRISWVPDPRRRDDQVVVLRELGARLDRYFARCADRGTFPQLWVSSPAVADYLAAAAARWRGSREAAEVRRLGELLSYGLDRRATPGQQALLTATEVLADHWTTGQQPGEDGHLGALLTWLAPPAAGDLLPALEAAEALPLAAGTDPIFDARVLAPRLAAYHAARRARAGTPELARRAGSIRAALEPVAARIYLAVQVAVARLQQIGPPLPALTELEAAERAAFADFRAARARGIPLAARDSPKVAALRLAEREEALGNLAAARLGDRLLLTRAILAGAVLTGRVRRVQPRPLGPRRSEVRIELASEQAALRLRPRDELADLAVPGRRLVVVDLVRTGAGTCVTLHLVTGARTVGVPAPGERLVLSPFLADWDRPRRTRLQLARRLQVPPWTHTPGSMPPLPPAPPPVADPLARVEALR